MVRHLGLRGRLLLLVVLALAPAFVLLVWTRIENARMVAAETEQRSVARAQLLAESQASRDQGAEQLLSAIVRNPSTRNPRSAECTTYLREVMDSGINAYINLGVITPDGVIACGSDPTLGLRVADREFFQKALDTGSFTIGELLRGRRAGRMLLNYALPVIDGTEVRGVATASLNVEWLRESLGRVPVMEGSGLALLDRTGAVIAMQPEDAWLGDRLDDATLRQIQQRDQTHIVRDGPDGIERH